MPTFRKVFSMEHGELFFIQDSSGKQVTFESLDDFIRCSGLDLTGKYHISYEPEIDIFIDSEDDSISVDDIPYEPYENIIGMIPTLIERKDDRLYGITDPDQIKKVKSRIALERQQESIGRLTEHEMRVRAGLPPTLSAEDQAALQNHAVHMQGWIDNPNDSIAYPPLPPGVTPPPYHLITIHITRVAGYGGIIGYKAVIDSIDENFTPDNLSLAVYRDADCSDYEYTTGAFQHDEQNDEWFAVCPPGQEPGNVDIHFGALYASAVIACFTLDHSKIEQTFAIHDLH